MSRRVLGLTVATGGVVFALVVAFGHFIGLATHVSGWKLIFGVGLGIVFGVIGLVVARTHGRSAR